MKRYFVYITLSILGCLAGMYSCGVINSKSLYLDNHTYSTGHKGMLGESVISFSENMYFVFKQDSPHSFSEGEFRWIGKDSIQLYTYDKWKDSIIYYDENRGFYTDLSGKKIKITRKKLYLLNDIFFLRK